GAKAPPPVHPVELIRLKAEPPRVLAPPKAKPLKEKPLAAAPPKPAARPPAAPKTLETAADKAETYTPPATPVGPVAPAFPLPAVPAAPAPAAARAIATEGIPTDYVNQVYARINRNADYPREAKLRRQQGRVGYRLTLDPRGALLSVDIQSSGSDILDEAARDAIRRAAPFPALPELGGSTYLLAGNIVFKIN
ncbi:MAG TPA: TonB family protein, partial [Janthinobacterium sp.]|nr:TonB family protein [Janthinobacterium sp.]